jgi:TRAP-type C4-dicarboxylate transport system substrate-binding protein
LEGTQVIWDLIENNADVAAEFESFKLFNFYVLPASELWTNNTPIRTPADMAGHIIRVPGAMSERIVNASGGATFVVGMAHAYDNLDRGVVTGTVADPGAVTTYNLWEVVDYGTVGLPLTAATHMMAMNWDTWNSLNEFEQAAWDRLTGNGRGLAEASAQYFDDEAAHSLNVIIETEMIELYYMTPADLALWDIAFESVVLDVLDSLTERGLNAQSVHDDLVRFRTARR